MVYIDAARILYHGAARSHLTADSLPELHAFAEALGVARCWFHHVGARHAHYDVTEDERLRAIRLGAMPVSSRVIVLYAPRNAKRKKP